MRHTKLKEYLELLSPLPEKDWDFFASRLLQRHYSKKELILQAGKVENYVSFIESEIIRYFVQEKEKEITFEIAFENSLLLPMTLF